jgi:hypothetical protein
VSAGMGVHCANYCISVDLSIGSSSILMLQLNERTFVGRDDYFPLIL